MRKAIFDQIHGYYFEQLETGMYAEVSKVMTDDCVNMYADLSGDTNPLHLDEEFAARTRTGGKVVHGMVAASPLSAIVGCRLPGPGCLWMAQTLRFVHPVKVGERVQARATIVGLVPAKQRVTMETICRVGKTNVIEGEALVWVPRREED